jgi:hypothetical protein
MSIEPQDVDDIRPEEDFIAELDAEIADERDRLMRSLDRVDALRSLHGIAEEIASELGRSPTLDETFDAGDSELRRAELANLARRIAWPEEGGKG